MGEAAPQRARLGEVLGVLAMATDLGTGLPMEHAIRTRLLSLELGRRIGLSGAELVDVYDLTLLRMLGCTADSHEASEYFGDERTFGEVTQHLDYGDPQGFGRWVMESFATDRPPAEREQMLEKLFAYTPERRREALAGHCEVAQMLATRLGFSGSVVEGLGFVFERWDGTGAPNGVRGSDHPIAVRLMTLCTELETHHRLSGETGTIAVARQRAGTAFDPALVDTFCNNASDILDVVRGASSWDRLLAAEPAPVRYIDDERLADAARVMGEFADMKSLYLSGHSIGVAGLAGAAAERCGFDEAQRRALEIAACAHDLGRVTVTTSIWDRPGPLTEREWEAVRLHAYYSERMLGPRRSARRRAPPACTTSEAMAPAITAATRRRRSRRRLGCSRLPMRTRPCGSHGRTAARWMRSMPPPSSAGWRLRIVWT